MQIKFLTTQKQGVMMSQHILSKGFIRNPTIRSMLSWKRLAPNKTYFDEVKLMDSKHPARTVDWLTTDSP